VFITAIYATILHLYRSAYVGWIKTFVVWCSKVLLYTWVCWWQLVYLE